MMSQPEVAAKTGVICESFGDQHANEKGSATEPSAARELALEEGDLQELLERLDAGLEYEGWMETDGAPVELFDIEAAQDLFADAAAAIRALGTSCEQLNKAVSNVPDQQENEPGAHGERERALEEAVRNAAMYLATGFITCPRCGEDVETKNTDAEYTLRAALSSQEPSSPRETALYEAARKAQKSIAAILSSGGLGSDKWWDDLVSAQQSLAAAIRALSSPDHADAGKVEGDGWLPIESAPKDGTVIQVWHQVHKCPISVLWKDDGFPYRGKRLNWYERTYTTAWPEHVFFYWRPLPSAPSQEVAG